MGRLKCSNLFRTLRHAMRRDFPTDEHFRAWTQFDILLKYRANFTFITKVVYIIGFFSIGKANFQESEDFMAQENAVYNQEMVDATFDVAKQALIVLSVIRVLLLLFSFKKLEVCKVYFFFQQVYKVIEHLLPRDFGA